MLRKQTQVTAGIDREAPAAWRDVVEVGADVHLLAHAVGVRREGSAFELHAIVRALASGKDGVDAAEEARLAKLTTEQRTDDGAHSRGVGEGLEQRLFAAEQVQLDHATLVFDGGSPLVFSDVG